MTFRGQRNFSASGFLNIYTPLKTAERIRVLIGISTNRQTFDLMGKAQAQSPDQLELQFSHAEVKEELEGEIEKEFEGSEDNQSVEEGVERFVEWIHNKKLQISAYPSDRIHAKVYIMTFAEGDRDVGRVITGSSNFTQAGLVDNLEFNVELKNRADYDFARSMTRATST